MRFDGIKRQRALVQGALNTIGGRSFEQRAVTSDGLILRYHPWAAFVKKDEKSQVA
jgi:hypothetical protein